MAKAWKVEVRDEYVVLAWPESERWACDGEYLTNQELKDLIAELQTHTWEEDDV